MTEISLWQPLPLRAGLSPKKASHHAPSNTLAADLRPDDAVGFGSAPPPLEAQMSMIRSW